VPLSHNKEKVTSFIAATLALTLFSAPTSYTQLNVPIVLGSTVGTAPASGAGFTVAMPVSGVQEQTIKLRKHAQPYKKHTGS